MVPLVPELRRLLENRIPDARQAAEEAARAILNTLAVNRADPFPTLTPEQRRLRNALRAKARQLGGGSQTVGFEPLVEELAYQQWHRMVFARFLAENNLLMHPSGVSVTLQDCADLAGEEGEVDAWAVAAKYAALMLPGIFSPEDPETQVRLAPEGQQRLEIILSSLPVATFQADDALGWMYQFWQSRKKDEINRSERKIGGADIAPVTQLFTEDYMVRFLLENSLGGWWATRHPNSPLLKNWGYLRYKEDGTPVAGSFPDWPKKVAEITIMDPCCGSGHFLSTAFEMLSLMRMEEEGVNAYQAAHSVLRDNLFGLEIDPRCTQIAAFALCLLFWKLGGFQKDVFLNIACTGVPVYGQLSDWKKLAKGDFKIETSLERIYDAFAKAPFLGSLINPSELSENQGLFSVEFDHILPIVSKVVSVSDYSDDSIYSIANLALENTLRALQLLSRNYDLVVTNVPYLTRYRQEEVLRDFCDEHYELSKGDLATAFIERCRVFAKRSGVIGVVSPQNWSYLPVYKKYRVDLITSTTWQVFVKLGTGAFTGISGEVVNVSLFIFRKQPTTNTHTFQTIDVSSCESISEKDFQLTSSAVKSLLQINQLANPDSRIVFSEPNPLPLLNEFAESRWGLRTADNLRFLRCFWEIPKIEPDWRFHQGTCDKTVDYGGRENILFWQQGKGDLLEYEKLGLASIQGEEAWGKKGIVVSLMNLTATLYDGESFDNNCAVVWPKNYAHFEAVWAYLKSQEFSVDVRRIDQSIKPTNQTILKVPFDLIKWEKIAKEEGALPEPYSMDCTQWLFGGNPVSSTNPLHVSVARLLGYKWPQQKDDFLCSLADEDGILCLPTVFGEMSAFERLRNLLAEAYGTYWSPTKQSELILMPNSSGNTLEDWLRDDFFSQHCKLFQNRPFIWHIWDGRKDGFSVLVNYHKLTTENLDRMIYTYLGDWINFQRARRDHGEPGADGRLVSALQLQDKLKLIREGEPPYDIYVRWKSLAEQPVGWDPDLNDGVRINIRPFVTAGVLRAKFNINWNKDRGKNPDGSERLNDLHFTLAEKLAARGKNIR